ncbi:MAG TPA: choice-of-anchor D domain-containing protein [Candidatus Sulfotelmatobacter sp.]
MRINATPERWSTVAALLATVVALITMLGCQGISAPVATKTTTQSQPTATGNLSAASSSVSFGTVQTGISQTKAESLTNTGTASVIVTQAPVTGPGFSINGLSLPATLDPGKSVNFNIVFTPAVVGSVTGSVSIISNASNANLGIALSASATPLQAQLGITPSSLDMGSVEVGTNGTASGVLTATGADVTVTAVSSNNAGFTLSGLSLPITIQAGHSTPFTVTFTPKSAGAINATLTFSSDAYPASVVEDVSGTGTTVAGNLAVTPSTLSVGNVAVGASGTATGTLTATGSNVTITAASSSNSRFALSGFSLPMTIQAGHSAQFAVTFSPQTTGAATATMTFVSDASTISTVDDLTGVGVKATTHTVNLSWNPSTSTNVVGYNVYRSIFGSGCGAYAKINSTLDASTSYGDNSVADGTTYCYVTTAVNSSDEESSYSAVVEAAIPAQ